MSFTQKSFEQTSNFDAGLSFKNSPFYEIQFRVGDVRSCEGRSPFHVSSWSLLTSLSAMSQHRNMVSIPVIVSDNLNLNRVLDDKSLRIMVFCAGDNNGVQDIAFPHQSEIKVNGNEVKANLRGLKNKPGSTRPVDITSFLRLKNDNRNLVEFTYALTQKVSCLRFTNLNTLLRLLMLTLNLSAEILSCPERLPYHLGAGSGRQHQEGAEDPQKQGD